MNDYDSNRIYDLAKKIHYKKTNNIEEANCYILNTCHIREKATEKVYHDVGRIKKSFKNKKKPIVIITGCVAQAEGDILLNKEKYIDAVIGPQSYHMLNDTILKIEKNSEKINSTEFEVLEKFDTLNLIKNSDSKISSNITIQEGCNKFCKFCVVPYTRGPEHSRSYNELLNESKELVENGVREITLLGQNVNAYNYNGKKLSDLIFEISQINSLKRIRYTTSHPIDFTDDLIYAHGDIKKLMPSVHLPVQSGSDKILKSMNRKHSIKDYLRIIDRLKKVNSKIKFSSDFIIGYPGETDKDFEETMNLLNEVQFINTYSFIFSPRPGTPAAKMSETDINIAKKRLIIFQKKARQIKLKYRNSLLKSNALVLFENFTKDNQKLFGRDEFSNSVFVKAKDNLKGLLKTVKIIGGNQNTLFGDLDEKSSEKDFAA